MSEVEIVNATRKAQKITNKGDTISIVSGVILLILSAVLLVIGIEVKLPPIVYFFFPIAAVAALIFAVRVGTEMNPLSKADKRFLQDAAVDVQQIVREKFGIELPSRKSPESYLYPTSATMGKDAVIVRVSFEDDAIRAYVVEKEVVPV